MGDTVKLVDICTPKQWKTIPTSALLDRGYPVYGANGIIGYYNKYNHENSVVAITCRGATCGSVHITVPNAYITGNAMCLDDLREDIEPYYLYYCLLHFDFQSVISGSAQPQITRQGLEKVLIPICSRDRQVSIANRLKKTENIIAKWKEELAKLDTLVKSRFIEMFGDPVTNPMGWKRDLLKNLGELNRGVSKHRPRNAPELLNGPYPLVQTGDVSNADTYITDYSSTYSELGLKQSRMWSKGTLCITIAANIAKTGILAFDACFPDSVVGFISGERTNQRYIHHWFSFFQKILEEQAPQSAQKNINLQLLSNLSVTMPPIDLQNQFAAFVQQVDKSKSVLQKLLEKQEILRAALMQEYFG